MKKIVILMLILGCNNKPPEYVNYEQKLDSCASLISTQVDLIDFYLKQFKLHKDPTMLRLADSMVKEAKKTWALSDSFYKKIYGKEIRSYVDDSLHVVDSSFLGTH